MNHVFGPVPSRRLGRSLGIDPVPFKTCNWNCVYCQLGRTAPLSNERREYVPVDQVLAQLERALDQLGPGKVDWVTFAGSGEPTLHAGLGRLVRGAKALTTVPVAVLTNGALLYEPAVRRDLLAADAVLPTVDAGSAELYRRISRPWPELTFERFVEGLVAFRREYRGRLWAEVMLIMGMNDSEGALRDIGTLLARIGPDAIHVNQPIRPPAEPWVEPPSPDAIAQAAAILGRAARVVDSIAPELTLYGRDDVAEAVVDILSRHPMDLEELVEALQRWSPGEVGEALARLAGSGRIRTVTRMSRRFWSCAEACYGEGARR